jgi:hypothetical protein
LQTFLWYPIDIHSFSDNNIDAGLCAFDPSLHNNKAIRWAAQYGKHCIVRKLLQDPRVDPSAESDYAIRWASANGHTETVKVSLYN